MNRNISKPPFLPLDRPPPGAVLRDGADGVRYVDCPRPLPDHPAHILDHLDRTAAAHGDRPFLMRREAPGGAWRPLTHGVARDRMLRIAQGLLDLGLAPGDRLMILSANSFEHLLLTYGAMQLGVTIAPVSPAYSLLSHDLAKLRAIHQQTRPRLVFAQHGGQYGRALAAILEQAPDIVTICAEAADQIPGARPFADLEANPPGAEVMAARARQDPDAPAKILFTSGSTGMPKGAVNTQRMLCSSQAMLEETSGLGNEPPVLLDWLPWHHTFGGNTNQHRVLVGGGTLYMDEGKPTPELFPITIANLREIAPTGFSTVPGAYGALAGALEADPELRRNFFRRMRYLSYGGAPLSQDIYERMQALAVAETGFRIPFSTGHGMTETPVDVSVHWNTERSGLIGLPLPGTTVKLVPHGDSFEMRLKGPQVTPGYWNNDALNQQAFDGEGFLRTGDAVSWVDDTDPAQGLVYAGRIAEEFKLANGSWVQVGTLRLTLLAALSPLVTDLLLTGAEDLGLLAWPDAKALAALCPDVPADTPLAQLVQRPKVQAAVTRKLAAHNRANPGATTRIARALLLVAPPSLDAGEVTDKRSINQGAALANRASDVDRLFADPPGPDIMIPDIMIPGP